MPILKVYFMIKHILVTSILVGSGLNSFAQVGIGTSSPDPSSILELQSSDKGFLPPRMSGVQRGQIVNPEDGLLVYCTDCCSEGILSFYQNPKWVNINPCLDYDLDGDGVNNVIDIDDDNDGIADSLECPTDFATFSGMSLDENSGAAFVTSSSVAGSLPTSVTVNVPTIIGGTNSDLQVKTGTNASSNSDIKVLRIEDNSGHFVNEGGNVKVDFTTSNTMRVFANNNLAKSNINQLDQFTFTPINPPSDFSWTVIDSTDAIINITGNSIEIKQNPSATINEFAQFEIETSSKIDGFNVEYISLSSGGGLNSGQFLFSFGCQDTDGDGTPDYHDLDSDDDGCADALESGMTASTSLTEFTTTAGSNGLADELETTVDSDMTNIVPNLAPVVDNGIHTCN